MREIYVPSRPTADGAPLRSNPVASRLGMAMEPCMVTVRGYKGFVKSQKPVDMVT